MSSNFVIGERFMAMLRREGIITEEQFNRTTEIVITAKAGEAVRMDHRTLLRADQLALIAQTLDPVAATEGNDA